jgi:flagellar assembly factor FliW
VDTKDVIEIETKPYGKMKVSLKQRVSFEEGLYGFEKKKEFYLLDMEENSGVMYYLQSAEDKEVAFILINPYMFKGDYVLDVSKSDLKKIGLDKEEEVKDLLLTFAIVTIPEKYDEMSANLLGPVLINAQKRLGIQALSLVEGYTTKHKILEELKKSSDKGGAGC